MRDCSLCVNLRIKPASPRAADKKTTQLLQQLHAIPAEVSTDQRHIAYTMWKLRVLWGMTKQGAAGRAKHGASDASTQNRKDKPGQRPHTSAEQQDNKHRRTKHGQDNPKPRARETPTRPQTRRHGRQARRAGRQTGKQQKRRQTRRAGRQAAGRAGTNRQTR